MKTLILAAGAVGLLAIAATAQTTHSATSHSATASDHNPAIKDSDPVRTTAAAEGANSFTEDQARSRLAEAGYTGVTRLAKDDSGVWRATATKDGKSVQVGLDFKGNIATR